MSRHVAIGPDGANLLGFLAAIGTLVLLSWKWAERDVRLAWTFLDAGWRPVIEASGEATDDDLIDALAQSVARRQEVLDWTALGADLPVDAVRFSEAVRHASDVATPEDRVYANVLAAFGCEACTDRTGRIQDTALRTMSGAGHQHFLAFMDTLVQETTPDHLRCALFEPWEYDDGAPSMRWDPVDDRRYAYRADNPSGSTQFPIRTVRGANRLAIEALPMFPTVPRGRRLHTTAFPEADGGRTIRWPIWRPSVTLRTLGSLLTLREIASALPLPADRLRLLGISEVFRSERITVGQLRNFTPAEALLGLETADPV